MNALSRLLARIGPRLAFFSLVALVACFPLLGTAARPNEFRDAQVLESYEDVAVRSVRDYGQWPLWNPYYCGGMYALGNPQTRFAAPTFLLSLVFGADVGAALTVFLLYLVGLEGAYRLLLRRVRTPLGAALAAPVFALSGHFATSWVSGWINFFGFQVVPWLLYGLALALAGMRRGLAIFVGSAAFIVGFGGTYAAPIAALLAAFEIVATFFSSKASQRQLVLGRALAAAWFALLACAFRLWPIAETMLRNPRVVSAAPRHSRAELLTMALSFAKPDHGDMSVEGYAFVGITAIALALVGLFHRRARRAAVLAGLCVWISGGYFFAPSAFAAVRALPVFGSLRYPERFLVVASLYLAELVAFGFQVTRIGARRNKWLAVSCVAWVPLAALAGAAEIENLHRAVAGAWLGAPRPSIERPFRQTRGNRWLAAHFPMQSRGSIACWEAYAVPMSSRLRGGLPAEEYLADPSAGRVERVAWSPNRIVLDVDTTRASRVLVNQNWDPGWRADSGPAVSEAGLLAADVPAGKRRLTFSFLPRSALGGALVTLGAIVATGVWLGSRRRWLRGSAAAFPVLVLAACWFGIREASPPRLDPTNADGSPLVVSELPASARSIGAEFADPIRLQAVALPARVDAAGNGSFELYWEIDAELPRTSAVFVHVETPDGRHLLGDHTAFGGSLAPADAPRSRLIRDAFAINLGPATAGEYRVYVGLFTRSNGKRTGIRSPGQGESDPETRVFVGAFRLLD